MGYRWLHGVTRGYRGLQGVHLSLFIKGLQKGIRSLDLYIAGSVDCWICRSLDLKIDGSGDRWLFRSLDQ